MCIYKSLCTCDNLCMLQYNKTLCCLLNWVLIQYLCNIITKLIQNGGKGVYSFYMAKTNLLLFLLNIICCYQQQGRTILAFQRQGNTIQVQVWKISFLHILSVIFMPKSMWKSIRIQTFSSLALLSPKIFQLKYC